MTKKEMMGLNIGLYKVYWKVGESSIAAMGAEENGIKWLACLNWLYPAKGESKWWKNVKRVSKLAYIEEMP